MILFPTALGSSTEKLYLAPCRAASSSLWAALEGSIIPFLPISTVRYSENSCVRGTQFGKKLNVIPLVKLDFGRKKKADWLLFDSLHCGLTRCILHEREQD